jgi:hypothetical protein
MTINLNRPKTPEPQESLLYWATQTNTMPTFRKPMLSTLLIYVLLLIVIFLFQRKMIYFPDTYPLTQLLQRAEQSQLKPWPSESDYLGLVSKTASASGKGTVIVFHGNAGAAIDRTYYLTPLEKLGYRVILAE